MELCLFVAKREEFLLDFEITQNSLKPVWLLCFFKLTEYSCNSESFAKIKYQKNKFRKLMKFYLNLFIIKKTFLNMINI